MSDRRERHVRIAELFGRALGVPVSVQSQSRDWPRPEIEYETRECWQQGWKRSRVTNTVGWHGAAVEAIGFRPALSIGNQTTSR